MGGSKAKKQKKELSQAEIWDDSALVQSWDDALAEYKKYHSMHAQGQTINGAMENIGDGGDQIGKHDDAVQMDPNSAPEGASEIDFDSLEDGELKEGEVGRSVEEPSNEASNTAGHHESPAETKFNQYPSVSAIPIAVSSGIQDEALKNLMMSWYYAGYYTGLFEGRTSPEGRTQE